MTRMNPPHSGAVVDVREVDVDRYSEAGWTKIQPRAETKKAAAKKAPSRKSKK